jgi:hypothetical protein
MLKGKSPKEIAAYYRGIAEDLDPDSVPVTLPQDLKDLVELGSLPAEEADGIARKREAKAKQPELEKRHQSEAAAKQAEQVQAQAFQKVQATGYQEIAGVAKGYQTRYGAEWDAIGKAVEAELEPLLPKMHPSAWAKLAKTVIEAEVAKRKTPLRTPSTTPAPTARPGTNGSKVMSEEDERKALSAGRSLA